MKARTKPQAPRWQHGPPNEPGYWLVETSTTELVAWEVEWDRYDNEDGTMSEPYLRFTDGMDSNAVEDENKNFPVRQSYGPIPKSRLRQKRREKW